MAIQNADAIQKLYVAYFNRPADYYGLLYWDDIVTKAGGSTAAISQAFSTSAEYQATYAGMDLRNSLNTIYKNLFGKSADEAGLEFWYNAVQTGKMTMANAVTEIAKGAQGTDLAAYNAKVAAASAFTNALDTTDERLGYSGEKANAVAKQFIAGVTDANTLATAIVPATLDQTVNTVIGAGQTAQTFQLTKGLDNYMGTSGNDMIVGSIDVAGSELNTLSGVDLINGGAGIDTLKVAHAAGTVTLGSLTNVEVVEITSAAVLGVTVDSTTTAGVTDLNIVRAVGAISATAGASTNVGVSMKDAAAIGTITVAGGKNVNIALTDAVSAINVGAAGAVDPVGAVVVSATGAAAVAGVATTTMGNITVGGGSTVSVTQKATVSNSALQADATLEKIVQGNVTITAAANTTDVTVKQDAAISAQSRAAVAGTTEVATAKFTALKAGESVTVGGLTFTAAKDLGAADVAAAFANLSSSAIRPTQAAPAGTATGDTNGSSVFTNGTFSGSLLANWSTGAANGDTVTFTARANTAMTNLIGSATATVTTTTEGGAATSAQNRLGIDAGVVTIDGGAALKTVTVDGFAVSTGAAGVNGATNAALATVTLANGGSFDIDSAAATLALKTTAVNGTVNIAAGTKTLNADVTTSASVTTTLASATAEAVNVSGAGNVAGTTAAAGLTAATSINTTGMTAAGSATFTIANGTTTTYTGGAAADYVTVSNAGTAITKAVTLGAGDDWLGLEGAVVVPTATLSGGEGTDIIAMNGASAAALSANGDFAGKIDGFEQLEITNSVTAATTVNLANMDGINYVISNNSAGTSAAATKATFSVNLAGSTLKAGDTVAFNGGSVTAAADTTANALALQLAAQTYTNWEVTSVAGSVITFTALVAGATTIVPTAPVFTVTDADANSTITQPISSSTAGTATGALMPALTIDKFAANGTLELVAAGAGVNVKLADASGSADVFNIVTGVVGTDLNVGAVNVSGVETINVAATDYQPTVNGSASIQKATLAVNAAGATSIVVTGNSHIDLSLGADAKSVATVNASAATGNVGFAANGSTLVTVTGGSGNDVLRASVGTDAKADVINGGAGNDVIYAGTNGAKLTGGAGNDTFVVSAASATQGNKEGNTYSEITDFSAGDLLQLQAFTGGAVADVSVFGKLVATLNESTASFSNFVNAAVKEANAGAAVWFNYKGDLYVVVDSGADSADTFENGVDLIVKLTGINGDNLTFNTEFGTAGLI